MMRFATIATLLSLCGATPVFAQKSVDMVKVATTASKPDDKGMQTITVEVTIEPGWHIYANPVISDFFKTGQTALKITSKAKLGDVKVEYPPGIRKKDPDKDIGEYAIYEKKVTLKASVTRAELAEPLLLELRVMACNDEKCYPPGTIAIKVP